jgi:hypothetical protein
MKFAPLNIIEQASRVIDSFNNWCAQHEPKNGFFGGWKD